MTESRHPATDSLLKAFYRSLHIELNTRPYPGPSSHSWFGFRGAGAVRTHSSPEGPGVVIRSGSQVFSHPHQQYIQHRQDFHQFRVDSSKRSGKLSGTGSAQTRGAADLVSHFELFFGKFPNEATRNWYRGLSAEQQYQIKREIYQDKQHAQKYAEYRFRSEGKQVFMFKLTQADLDKEEAGRKRLALEKEHMEQEPGHGAVYPEPESHSQQLFSVLETIGRGEDPVSEGIERTTENLVRISYQHFPEGTAQVLDALSHIDSAIDAVVEFIDDSTGNTASAVWQKLDDTTQARILGAGKVLSVLVPIAKVKGLAELARAPSPALKKDGWHPESVEARHQDWQEHYDGREDHEYQGISGFIPAPENLKAFPDARSTYGKTPVQGGKILRDRWRDTKGNIYEWDYRHGTVEMYNKHGKHLGEFNPNSGIQMKPADKTRKVEP